MLLDSNIIIGAAKPNGEPFVPYLALNRDEAPFQGFSRCGFGTQAVGLGWYETPRWGFGLG